MGNFCGLILKKTIDVDVNAFVQVEDSVSSHAKDKYARVFQQISNQFIIAVLLCVHDDLLVLKRKRNRSGRREKSRRKFCEEGDIRSTQSQFSENIHSEDDLRPRIFGTFVVKFLVCLPLLGFFEHLTNGIIAHFNGFLP